MTINLQKGQRIDLTKGSNGLSKIIVGLGWDPITQPKKGFFGSLLNKSNDVNFDCDASVFMLNESGKLNNIKDLIYFGNLRSNCEGVVHTGDNLTGDGDGDDEVIIIDLKKISPQIQKMLFTVNIYKCVEKKQDFGMVKNAYIRVVNETNKQELIKFDLSENYSGKTALMVGEIYRHNGEWKFVALGQDTNDTCLQDIVNRLMK